LETYLLQNADIATITQNNLLKKMSDMGAERFALLPNAFEDWEKPGKKSLPPIRKGRITIGYFGHLTSSWFDWPLVVSLAKRRPDWTFHIIGYGLDKRIVSLDNLIFLGRVEHGDLPALAKNWDAAMIPFQASKLSAAVDPIKIYEYISLRLPTVVTGMPHLASYPGVFIANDGAEFEAAVEKAAKTKIDTTTVETFLSVNRWSNRINDLLTLLDEGEYWNATSLALTKDDLTANQMAV
jgi:glycosyltransferase involved in cell wall biosynthesis